MVQTKEQTMQSLLLHGPTSPVPMDYEHSAVLEGLWKGLDAWEIAEQLDMDTAYVARLMDDYRSMGY